MEMTTGTGKTSSYFSLGLLSLDSRRRPLVVVVVLVVHVITLISDENVAAIMRRPWLIMRFWTSPGFLLTTRMPCGPTAARKAPLVSVGAAAF